MRRVGLAVVIASLTVTVAASSASLRSDPNLSAAKAFVAHRCATGSGPRDTSMWVHGWRFNALFGDCGGGDGRDQHIWFFVGRRFVGTDAPNSSREIVGVWRQNNTLAFLYVLYGRTDAMCCPTGGGAIVRFRWNGRGFVPLDKLPPRQLGDVAAGR
jgi:hypothetical protein